MRLVLDQGVPRDAAASLRELGFDCVHVGEVGMSKAADDEILAWSGQDAIVVTLDADFHMILAVSGASRRSVIRLRMEGLDAPHVVALVSKNAGALRDRTGARGPGHSEGTQDHMPSAAAKNI
jgi:predicted nuclease of predicted toxin-antitoxin system